jgi:hypothetical protein
MVAQVLGDSEGSRLYWSLVETGIAEEAQMQFDGHDGVGEYVTYAACRPEDVERVDGIVRSELARIGDDLRPDELANARAKVVTAVTIGGERPAGRMRRLGALWLYRGTYASLEDELARIESLVADDLRSVIRPSERPQIADPLAAVSASTLGVVGAPPFAELLAASGGDVWRIIDIEVYRMMAMLAFPEARRIGSELDRVEQRLSDLVARLDVAPAAEEPEMLHEVTRLSALQEQLATAAAFRFGAARAYRSLVRQRGEELRETRLQGLQTPTDFLVRRFEPAMATCDAVATRLDSMSERIARASGLLRTRVEIERERQNQALLEAMNRRAKLQLHLQQTVEGLSVAAISYYATGLAGYVFKAAARSGVPIEPEYATGITVVPIVLAVWWAMRSVRVRLTREMPID